MALFVLSGGTDMSQSNYGYRLFFKKLTNIEGRSISSSQLKVRSMTLDRDLLKKTTSRFEVLELPTSIELGDVVGMYDSFGTILYTGVVGFLDNNTVQTYQPLDIFEDSWLWHNPKKTSIELTLKDIIQTDYQNSNDVLLNSIFDCFNLNTISATNQTLETREDQYVTDFSVFLYDIYEKYSIQLLFNIPYEESTPSIDIGIPSYEKLVIGNNANIFRNFNIVSNVYETNKMVVYSEETGAYRSTWYGTTSGITDDSASLCRLQKIKTNIIFSDDDINVLKASSLRNEMYNHEITCEMVLDNKLLTLSMLKLGQEADIYYNGQYYNSILTGYNMQMKENEEIVTITLKFGLVRTSLTSKLFKRLAK